MDYTRESLIFSFDTHQEKVRTLVVPDPMTLQLLEPEIVQAAAQSIIMSNVFDENHGSGSLRNLNGVVHERVEALIWI